MLDFVDRACQTVAEEFQVNSLVLGFELLNIDGPG